MFSPNQGVAIMQFLFKNIAVPYSSSVHALVTQFHAKPYADDIIFLVCQFESVFEFFAVNRTLYLLAQQSVRHFLCCVIFSQEKLDALWPYGAVLSVGVCMYRHCRHSDCICILFQGERYRVQHVQPIGNSPVTVGKFDLYKKKEITVIPDAFLLV